LVKQIIWIVIAIAVAIISTIFFVFGFFLQTPDDSEDRRVWRLQLELKTADSSDDGTDDSDDGTDDSVSVKYNDEQQIEVSLDYSHNDREPGDKFAYDLHISPHVSRLSDIDFLEITKTGSDSWCIEEIGLVVNDVSIYYESFTELPNDCLLLDAGSFHVPLTHLISSNDLRSHPNWEGFGFTLPLPSIKQSVVKSVVESVIGHELDSRSWVKWDGDPSVTRVDSDSYRVTVPLEFDPEKAGEEVNSIQVIIFRTMKF